MNKSLIYTFLVVIFAGFGATICYQYQSANRTFIVAGENNETSGETDTSFGNIFNEVKYLTDRQYLHFGRLPEIQPKINREYSIPDGILVTYDHYSPPEIQS